MKYISLIILFSCLAIRADIAADIEKLQEYCISVNLIQLNNSYISAKGKAGEDGLWQVPLSPEHLAEKINEHLVHKYPDLEAKVYSTLKRPNPRALKAIFKKSSMIIAYESTEFPNIRTEITIYKEPQELHSKFLEQFMIRLDNQLTLAIIKSIRIQNLMYDTLIPAIKNIGSFPKDENYFDNWNRYSFVSITKKYPNIPAAPSTPSAHRKH